MSRTGTMIAVLMAAVFAVTPITAAQETLDWHTPYECEECHYGKGAVVMPAVVNEWKLSEHALSYDEGYGANTICAQCKSPLQYDPDAILPALPESNWEGITCYVCHTPRIVENGVPTLGHELRNYIPGRGSPETAATSGEVLSMYSLTEDPQQLCLNCHTQWRHESVFLPGYGRNMEKKGVKCIDCHMPKIPAGDDEYRQHSLDIQADFSCGINRADCHNNKDSDWAAKQLAKGKIHNVGYDPAANQPWQ